MRHGEPVERTAEIDIELAELDRGVAQHVFRAVAQQRFGEIHQVVVVLIRLVKLEHGELGVVSGTGAFVSVVAVDFEHLVEATDNQTLKVELRRDAHVHLLIKRVVMCDEWLGRSAAGNRVHHRRFHFEIAALDVKIADEGDHLRANFESAARLGAHDQVNVALPIFLLLIGQAVKFFGQWSQRFSEQPQRFDFDGQLTFLGAKNGAYCAKNIAHVPMLKCFVHFRAYAGVVDVELDSARHILHRGKRCAAHHPLQHHAARDGDLGPQRV